MTAEYTMNPIWGAWAVSWIVAMPWSNRTEKRDAIGAELFFRILFYVSVILPFAFPPTRHEYAQTQLWHFGDAMNWILVTLTVVGLSFTWWARIHRGRLWPDCVVKKVGRHVIDTGPYSLVRHPIYAGLIFAAFATAIEKRSSFALLGVAMSLLPFTEKLDVRNSSYAQNWAKTSMTAMHARPRCWSHSCESTANVARTPAPGPC